VASAGAASTPGSLGAGWRFGGWGGGRFGGWGWGGLGWGGFYPGFAWGGFYPGFYGAGYGLYGAYGYPWYGYGLGYGYPGYGLAYNYPNYVYGPGYPGGFGYSSAYVAPSVSVAVTRGLAGTGRRYLGIDEQPTVASDGTKAIRVGRVYSGTAAEKAGLQAGDVIYSINGYLIEVPGNLAWVIANAAADNVLKMNVRTVRDGQLHTITVPLL
jgi:hypothetical protein